MVRAVFDPVAQNIDHAALGDLALQPRQELPSGRAIVVEIEGFGNFRLSGVKKGAELGKVTRIRGRSPQLDRGSIRYRRIVLE